MKNATGLLLPVSLAMLLAACGAQPSPGGSASTPSASTPAPVASSTPALDSVTRATLDPNAVGALALAATTTLSAGQTRQFNVYVGGQPAQPGQLVWTTTNAGVATVTQDGLVAAVAAGNATVRAALSTNSRAYIDFPIVVQGATTTPPATGTTPASSFAQQVLSLTNAARAQARTCGGTSYAATTPLTYNAQLESSAQAHAADMAAKNYFSHTSLDGRTFDQRITATGYAWRTIGENIAAGYPSPDAVVQGWLTSPGHCANIMNPSFKELGVGYATGGSYGSTWVQDFGTR